MKILVVSRSNLHLKICARLKARLPGSPYKGNDIRQNSRNERAGRQSIRQFMKKVIVLGASGNIARHVIDILASAENIQLTLFARNSKRIQTRMFPKRELLKAMFWITINFQLQLKDRISSMQISQAIWKQWLKILSKQWQKRELKKSSSLAQ